MDNLPFSLTHTMAMTEPIRFALVCLGECWRLEGRGTGTTLLLQDDPSVPDQGYVRTVGSETITLAASGDAGLCYGLLDLRLSSWQTSCTKVPYLKKRGIKYNIPLDMRTPSYSDASDMAFHSIGKVWDFSFWQRFLDAMAKEKYNVLSLWSLSPFPSLVKVPGFEAMSLSDVQCSALTPKPSMSGDTLYEDEMQSRAITLEKLSIEEKIAFFNRVLAYAKDRMIEVYLFTWNLFFFGNTAKELGISASVENPTTKAYLRSATKALLESYPLLAGLGFTAGEQMSLDAHKDVSFLHDAYAQAVKEYLAEHPKRKFLLIHRTHWAGSAAIEEQYKQYDYPFALSFKYSNAHLHSHSKPNFLNRYLKENPTAFPLFLTLRDDDYYLHRFAGFSFVQAYLRNLPSHRIEGFYLGSDGYSWGWETVSRHLEEQLYLEKHWCKLALFGQLSYDPELAREDLLALFLQHYPTLDAPFFSLFEQASSLLNLVTTVHWHDWDFQWYVEGCCKFLHPPIAKLAFEDILDFLACPSMPDSGYLSVGESLNQETDTNAGRHVLSIVEELKTIASLVLEGIERYRQPTQEHDEVWEMGEDIHSLALLGSYYAAKLEAAYLLGKKDQACLSLLEKAASLWEAYAKAVQLRYRPQRFARLCSYIDLRQFNEHARLDLLLAKEYLQQQEGGTHALVE